MSFSVHSVPSPGRPPRDPAQARRGRWQMYAVLAVCAAPVVASYLAFYFDIRPHALTNYSDLITPPRPLPAALPIAGLGGAAFDAQALRGQWLLVVVSRAACDAVCERQLWLQRQLHESLGAEKERVEKVWIVDDDGLPRPQVLRAIGAGEGAARIGFAPATVLRIGRQALASWLAPAHGRSLEDHIYVVDPRGDWMMRAPPDADPARLKSDLVKLLRASASWDRPGR